MIINSIKNLCDYLKTHMVDEADWDKVESLTSNIIIDDGYVSKDNPCFQGQSLEK